MTLSFPLKPSAWCSGYAFEATLPRASGTPIGVEATISPEGRLLDFGVTGSAAAAEDLGLMLVDFFCAEMAAKGVDGPHVADLIAALPENSPASLLLAAVWEQHPEAQPEPRIARGFSAPAAPDGTKAAVSEAELDAAFGAPQVHAVCAPTFRADLGRFLGAAREERAADLRGAQDEA